MSETRFTTAEAVAEEWGTSPGFVRLLVRRGELPAYRLGRLVKLKQEDVDAYLARVRQPAVPA